MKETFIHPTAVIYPNVMIGEGVYIGPFCVIGAPPEHTRYDGPGQGVLICDGVIMDKAVVVDSGVEGKTYIGSNSRFMSGVHVGHDAYIYPLCILSPKCCIGGHSVIEPSANIGMGALIHQNVTIPSRCMIGMGAVVSKAAALKMEPAQTYVGNPARWIGPNKKWAVHSPDSNPKLAEMLKVAFQSIVTEEIKNRNMTIAIKGHRKGFQPVENETKNIMFKVRLSESEKDTIRDGAEKMGIPMGEFVRAAVKLLDRYEVVES